MKSMRSRRGSRNFQEQERADNKKNQEREDAEPTVTEELVDQSEQGWAQDSREFTTDIVKAEEFRRLVFGNHGGIEGAAECLGSALNQTHAKREYPKMNRRGHQVSTDGNECINTQTEQDDVFCTNLPCEPAKKQRAGDTDKLGQKQCADHIECADADFASVHRRYKTRRRE